MTSYQPRDYKAPQNGRIKSLHPLGTEADRLQVGGAATNPESSRTALLVLLFMILEPVLGTCLPPTGPAVLQMCSEYTSWRMHVLSKRLADLAAEVSQSPARRLLPDCSVYPALIVPAYLTHRWRRAARRGNSTWPSSPRRLQPSQSF